MFILWNCIKIESGPDVRNCKRDRNKKMFTIRKEKLFSCFVKGKTEDKLENITTFRFELDAYVFLLFNKHEQNDSKYTIIETERP